MADPLQRPPCKPNQCHGDVLCLSPPDAAQAQRRHWLNDWQQRLPQMPQVRHLWLDFQVSQGFFELVSTLSGLETLAVQWSRIEQLAPLTALPRLSALRLGSSPRIEDLSALSQLPKLHALALESLKRVDCLRELGRLYKLSQLELGAGLSESTPWRIQSLAPLRGLEQLQELTLGDVRVNDDDLQCLAQLPSLRRLHISNRFPMQQYARLSARSKRLRCERFTPWVAVGDCQIACPKCSQTTDMVLVTGRREPFLCRRCDSERLKKCEQRFHDAAIRGAAS